MSERIVWAVASFLLPLALEALGLTKNIATCEPFRIAFTPGRTWFATRAARPKLPRRSATPFGLPA